MREHPWQSRMIIIVAIILILGIKFPDILDHPDHSFSWNIDSVISLADSWDGKHLKAELKDVTSQKTLQSSDGTLWVDGPMSGVELTGDQGDSIRVKVDLRAFSDRPEGESLTYLRQCQVQFVSSSDRMHLTIKRPDESGDIIIVPNWRITVPSRLAAVLSSGSGQAVVQNISGQLDVQSESGGINLTDVGAAKAYSNSGAVQVYQASGFTDTFTNSGAITLEDVVDVQARSTSGAIEISRISGSIQASSNSGSIHFEEASGAITAHSDSGSVNGEISSKANSPIALNTNSGSIDLSLPEQFRANLEARTSSGSIDSNISSVNIHSNSAEGAINGGGVAVRLEAQSGSIDVNN